jgi:hypothetical protein
VSELLKQLDTWAYEAKVGGDYGARERERILTLCQALRIAYQLLEKHQQYEHRPEWGGLNAPCRPNEFIVATRNIDRLLKPPPMEYRASVYINGKTAEATSMVSEQDAFQKAYSKLRGGANE